MLHYVAFIFRKCLRCTKWVLLLHVAPPPSLPPPSGVCSACHVLTSQSRAAAGAAAAAAAAVDVEITVSAGGKMSKSVLHLHLFYLFTTWLCEQQPQT